MLFYECRYACVFAQYQTGYRNTESVIYTYKRLGKNLYIWSIIFGILILLILKCNKTEQITG